jgi:hypothetical protein
VIWLFGGIALTRATSSGMQLAFDAADNLANLNALSLHLSTKWQQYGQSQLVLG